MKKVFKYSILCGAILMLASCKNDEGQMANVSPDESAKLDVTVEKGMLKFKSPETCQQVLGQLGSTEKIQEFSKRYPAFKSMNQTYSDMIREDLGKLIETGGISKYEGAYRVMIGYDGEKSYDRAIMDQAVAAVVNQAGVVQIGDSLYKFSEAKSLRMHARHISEAFNTTNPNVASKDVLHRTVKVLPQKNARTESDHNYPHVEYDPGPSYAKRRFCVMGWSTNYWFPSNYWSTGVRVNHQRKNWIGWSSYDAKSIVLSGYFTVDGFPRSYAGQSSNFNFGGWPTSELQYRYSEDWTTSNMGTVFFTFTWSGVGDDNVPRGYSQNWTETI